MAESDPQNSIAEFDRSQYPENLSCFLLPLLGEKAEIQIRTAEDESPVFYVPRGAVQSMHIHKFHSAMDEEGPLFKEVEDTLASAFVACRVDEEVGGLSEDETVAVVLPDNPEPILVPKKSLVRRRTNPKEMPEVEAKMSLRYEEGWKELLSAPDAADYQQWIEELCATTTELMPEMESVRRKWLAALELVADAAIDPDDLKNLAPSEVAETALLTLKENIDSMGWEDEGLAFIIPNLQTGEEVTIDLRSIPEVETSL